MVAIALLATLGYVVNIVKPFTAGPGDGRGSTDGGCATASTSVPHVEGAGQTARFTYAVDGAMTVGYPCAKTISLWTRPSTSSGCDISPCQPGTQQAGTLTLPAEVTVTCVARGQQIRNGAPDTTGF